MFSLSKFLIGGGAASSSLGLSAFLAPLLTSTGPNSIFDADLSNEVNLERLQTLTEELKTKLDDWISKFDQSKGEAQKSKNGEFEKSLSLMTAIQGNEENLKKLYEVIQEKLKTMGEKSKELTSEVENKLKLQSNLSQLKTVLSNLSSLLQLLSSWENNISKVIQEFENHKPENSASTGGGGTGQTTETEGQKAQKTLEEVKEQFKKIKENISTVSSSFKSQQLQIFGKDWANYLDYLSSNVKITWLEQYLQLLNRTVQTTNKDATKTTAELNKNSESLKKSHDEYNRLKLMESSFHRYSEDFKNHLKNMAAF
ncbi:hypothetical protein [Candidatus Mycoplasma haematominutum]|uniref:Uncharacterized protein n=1 Tax=Candidatus Mycoplasma haematominutum 'Birmingham 1' TaxID=1116213 RepID=G8C3D8_9MOLU|nr:hypothetical protein [Candidatus Mycoplasma haematominutum]CCE66836.1 hypothetical protein MHM_03180 [Candidatus Mycoplasma haematominutum 'Birmingham 1']